MDNFYVLIVGGRSFGYPYNDRHYLTMKRVFFNILKDKVDKNNIVIVSGGAKGTQHSFELSKKYDNPLFIYRFI